MDILIYLIPIALALGLLGLCAFMWSLKNGQFDDLDGAAERVLYDDDWSSIRVKRIADRDSAMLKNPNVLIAILLVVALLFVLSWIVFGGIAPLYFGLALTPIGMIIMVALLATFPKDPSDI